MWTMRASTECTSTSGTTRARVSFAHDDGLSALFSRTPPALYVKATRGVWGDAIAYLKRGLLMCYYWKYLHGDHLLKRCYPITVREIRPGGGLARTAS